MFGLNLISRIVFCDDSSFVVEPVMAPYAVVDTKINAQNGALWQTRLILLNSSKDRQHTVPHMRDIASFFWRSL